MYYSDDDLLALSERYIDNLLDPPDGGAPKLSSYYLMRWEELQREVFLEQAENSTSFVELARLMGFDLSNYNELEKLSPHLIALELETRAWMLELNIERDAYKVDFDTLSNDLKKQIIENHIKRPISCYSPRHKDFSPAYEMEMAFSWEPTEQGALFSGEYKTRDHSITNRMLFAINPYAPMEAIQERIRLAIMKQQQQIKISFPKIGKGSKTDQSAYKLHLIKNKIIPAIDLYIVKSLFNQYGAGSYFDLSDFKHGDIELFNGILEHYPRAHKEFEANLVKFLSEPFIFWLKSE